MDQAQLVNLKDRYEAIKADKMLVMGVWDQIETYIMPLTGRYSERFQPEPTQTTNEVVWDLTAPLANEHLASNLHGNVTNPAARWNDFEWEDLSLEKDQNALRYREALATAVWDATQASDFNSEIAAGYNEHSGIGNMVLMIETLHPVEWKGLNWTSVPAREFFPELDALGGLYRAFRLLRWTAVQCIDKFGENGCPDSVKKKAAEPNGGTVKFDVLFCVWRRPEIPAWQTTGVVADDLLPDKERPFGSVYMLLESTEQLGDEGGYYEMPFILARWNRMPNSVWGFGRGHIALRNVKFVNGMKELIRAQAACEVAPRLIASERGIQSAVKLGPGEVTEGDPQQVKVLESTGRTQVGEEVLENERKEIRRAFHEDELQLKDSPQMTLGEAQIRRDMMNRDLASPVGRLETEALKPAVEITLAILYRAGKLPEPPDIVKQKKAVLRVKFIGPIARAQALDQVAAMERSAAYISNLLKLGFEEAKYYFDVGESIRTHARLLGTPADTIRSEEEAQKLIQADQQAARAAQAAATAKDAMQAHKAAADAQAAGAGAAAGPPGGGPMPMAPPNGAAPGGAGPIPFPLGAQPGLVPAGGRLP